MCRCCVHAVCNSGCLDRRLRCCLLLLAGVTESGSGGGLVEVGWARECRCWWFVVVVLVLVIYFGGGDGLGVGADVGVLVLGRCVGVHIGVGVDIGVVLLASDFVALLLLP